MRTFATLHALCTFDLDQQQEAFDQQVTFDDTDLSTASQIQSGLVTLAASAASQQFSFGSVSSADTLLVIAYDEVQVQLGGNTAPLVNVRPVPASAAASVASVYQRQSQPGVLFLRGKVASLHLTNPSSTASARVFVGVVGNAL
jgi:hypothetical protein